MAYYARDDFFNNPEILARSVEILKGKLTLDWMTCGREDANCRPSHPRRGLTFGDPNVGRYGWDQIPERIRHNYSMAPRGAVLSAGLPHLGYDINRKSEVWSENAPELYEESKARHWIPSREVHWEAVEKLDHSPDFAEAWNARATAYYMAGEFGPSVADIARVLTLNPRHFGALSGLAMILEESGKPEKALEVYRAALAIHPHLQGATEAVERLETEAEGQEL